jgi:hypothetical protein
VVQHSERHVATFVNEPERDVDVRHVVVAETFGEAECEGKDLVGARRDERSPWQPLHATEVRL